MSKLIFGNIYVKHVFTHSVTLKNSKYYNSLAEELTHSLMFNKLLTILTC